LPRAIQHCYLGSSAVTLIHFLDTRGIHPANAAAVSMGLLPTRNQLATVRSEYPNAKLHCLFGDDPVGRVTACLIALWSTGRDGIFSLSDTAIRYRANGNIGEIPIQHFSLFRFERAVGIRSGIRTH
jgi:hypothetical protein